MSTFFKSAGLGLCALMFAAASHAQIVVDDPWVRATVPSQTGTGAFMKLTSEKDTRLVAADSPVAEHVEVHEMAMENNVMKMRQIPGLDLPAGKTVELKPGGYHIMFINLHQQMKAGEQVPLTLTFEGPDGQRSNMKLMVPVKPLSTPAGGHGHSQPAHGHAPHGHGHGATQH